VPAAAPSPAARADPRPPVLALTRAVPSSIARCELTHLAREPIDLARARAQHRAYEDALRSLGCTVRRLPPAPDLPDSVFVEDAAVVLDEVAIIARPGAEPRRAEVPSVAEALRPHRPLVRIQPPGTLDGGDVLPIGRDLFVGTSGRTNAEGVRQLRAIAGAHGYAVHPIAITGCLHLKTAVTQVGEATVLVNPAWLDARALDNLERIEVAPGEPFAANAVLVGGAVLHAAAHPRTADRLRAHGIDVHPVAASELAKAEAGLTCCSILVPLEP
jgi:dimethylargininase